MRLPKIIRPLFIVCSIFSSISCASGQPQAQNQFAQQPEATRQQAEAPAQEERHKFAKNVILFIGDGMGFEEVRAAGMFRDGKPGEIFFETFPYKTNMTTLNVNGEVTDSAASATAMATGHKVFSYVLSVELPGQGGPLETILEQSKAKGLAVGLVSTTFISHATPAAFGAHQTNRGQFQEIINDYMENSRPNILFGGAKYISPAQAEKAGYTVVENKAELLALDTESVNMVSGQFGEDHMPYESQGLGDLPHLSEMTGEALKILDNDPDGFFLMVEGGRIDHAGHRNNITNNVRETVELANAVRVAVAWANGRDDTLIIVTADHETGGLIVIESRGKGNEPDVLWGRKSHTDFPVPVYAWGSGADQIGAGIDNTDIYQIIKSALAVFN